jgi:hypothetical protein
MVGTDNRIALFAADLVKHWEARYATMEGNAMFRHARQSRLPVQTNEFFKSRRSNICEIFEFGARQREGGKDQSPSAGHGALEYPNIRQAIAAKC